MHDELGGADAEITPPAFDALVAGHQLPCAQEYLYHNIDIDASFHIWHFNYGPKLYKLLEH